MAHKTVNAKKFFKVSRSILEQHKTGKLVFLLILVYSQNRNAA